MKDKYFLDTNILIYTFDASAPAKQKKALELVNEALSKNQGVISYQVVQEFFNVATRKFAVPLSVADAKLYFDRVLMPMCELYADPEFYQFGLEIKELTHFSFYDALIVAAAIKTNCNILYSEDLEDGQLISGLAIKNPFH